MSGRSEIPAVRPAILAGSWYPASPDSLAAAVTAHLAAAAAPDPDERPTAMVVPHAGYAYSGPVAGAGYGLLRGLSYDRVFILAPSHRAWLTMVSPSPFAAYRTPLGDVPVDREAADALADDPFFLPDAEADAVEHSVEIQLPFLQIVLGEGLKVVPLLVPHLDADRRRGAAAALAPWCDGRSLFIVSSDFTHYGESYGYVPFTDRVPERLADLDAGAIELLLAGDADGLLDYGRRTGITMCGMEAAALLLSAPLSGGGARRVAYARSGDRDGDYSLSVSYAALILATSLRRDQENDHD